MVVAGMAAAGMASVAAALFFFMCCEPLLTRLLFVSVLLQAQPDTCAEHSTLRHSLSERLAARGRNVLSPTTRP